MKKTIPRSAIQTMKTSVSAIIEGMMNPNMNKNNSTFSIAPDCAPGTMFTFSSLG